MYLGNKAFPLNININKISGVTRDKNKAARPARPMIHSPGEAAQGSKVYFRCNLIP
jgi:hypothetical protein